jgi:G:T/U-mismatch repair DNA glycosylase
LDEEIEDDRSARKMDHGKLNKRKKPLLDALEHCARRKERQADEALKTRVKLT